MVLFEKIFKVKIDFAKYICIFFVDLFFLCKINLLLKKKKKKEI